MTTTETGTTTASDLLAEVQAESLIGEARLPKIGSPDDLRTFLTFEAGDMDRYDRYQVLAQAVKAPKVAKAYQAVEELHNFFNDMSPVRDARDELDGALLKLIEKEFGEGLRELAYEEADLSSRFFRD